MDTKTKRTIKHILSGIALLIVLSFAIFASNSEYAKVRARAYAASQAAENNAAQIDRQSEKIAKLEADLKTQQNALVVLKQKQAEQPQIQYAKPAKKASPPKTYPKPPADFVPLDQQQKPKKKKKGWWIFG